MSYKTNPATTGRAVTPGTALTKGPCRAFYIGVTGNLVLTHEDGTSITYPNVPVGVLPIGAAAVESSGTTATSIFALY